MMWGPHRRPRVLKRCVGHDLPAAAHLRDEEEEQEEWRRRRRW